MRIRETVAEVTPVKILSGYLVFGGLWILLSDRLASSLVQSRALLTQVQTIKGWVFVFLSGVLILGLVQTRERQLQASRDRLARASEELRVLHRVFRHDIRNDLTVIQGYIDLVREELDEEKPRSDLDRAYESTQRVLATCEKFQSIEAAHQEGPSSDTVDVRQIVEWEIDRLESVSPGVTVAVDGPPSAIVLGDRSLRYAIRELFDNAVEHHEGPPDDCHIEVGIERSATSVTITIADAGPGIEPYELRALERGTESPLEHTSGVGLWLVKWLCHFFNGTLEVERRPGGGTVARLSFESIRRDAESGD